MSWKQIYATIGNDNNLSIKIITKKCAVDQKKLLEIEEKC